MINNSTYDIFLSYRRGNGSEMARLLQSSLHQHGYRVFLDVDELRTGHFDKALLRQIEAAPNFIVVLSPGALDRCSNEGDWLRIEIAHALKNKKKIVPVMLNHFFFPPVESMPEELRELDQHHGVKYSHEYHDAMMDQIMEFIGPPANAVAAPANKRWRVLLGAGLTAVAAGGVMTVYRSGEDGSELVENAQVPAADMAFLKSLASDFALQIARVNVELEGIDETSKRASRFFKRPQDFPSEGTANPLVEWTKHRLNELPVNRPTSVWTMERNRDLERMGLPVADVQAFFTGCLPMFYGETQRFYEQTRDYATMPPTGWIEEQDRWAEMNAEILRGMAEAHYFGILEVLAQFPDEAAAEFEKQKPMFTHLPSTGKLSAADARTRAEAATKKNEALAMRMASMVGNASLNLRQTEQWVDVLQKKNQGVAAMEETLRQKEKQLADTTNELIEKCRLVNGEDAGMMWGKILRLRKAGLEKEAEEQLARYVEMNISSDAEAPTYVAAARAFWAWPDAPKDVGVIIVGFKDGLKHSILKIGDILIEKNGVKTGSTEDLEKITADPTGNHHRFLRLRKDGKFEREEGKGRVGEPGYMLGNLRESD